MIEFPVHPATQKIDWFGQLRKNHVHNGALWTQQAWNPANRVPLSKQLFLTGRHEIETISKLLVRLCLTSQLSMLGFQEGFIPHFDKEGIWEAKWDGFSKPQ